VARRAPLLAPAPWGKGRALLLAPSPSGEGWGERRYWLPLPRERAGVRGGRHREPSQVESPDAHPFKKEFLRLVSNHFVPSRSYNRKQHFWRKNLSSRSHSRRLSCFDQPAPHPSPLPRERELVTGSRSRRSPLTPALSRGRGSWWRRKPLSPSPPTPPLQGGESRWRLVFFPPLRRGGRGGESRGACNASENRSSDRACDRERARGRASARCCWRRSNQSAETPPAHSP